MGIFQTFEYNGKTLQLATYESEPSTNQPAMRPSASAPGAGKIEIGPLNLSAGEIAPGEALTLTAQIKGKQIAFVYTEILLLDQDLNQVYGPVAREYLRAERNKEVGGVLRPVWDSELSLTLTLAPGLRLLTNGVDSAFGFLTPEGYASTDYRLEGLYTSADETTKRRAQITFDSTGKTKKLVAFQELGVLSAPHALTLNQGDQFSPFVQIHTPPADENHGWQILIGLSTPLTFHSQPLRWVAEPPMPGHYLVGLLVQDLDGGLTRKYAPLVIRPADK